MKIWPLVLLLSCTACLDIVDPLDPEVGEPLVAPCSNVDSDPDRNVSFIRDISPLINDATAQPGCSCHLPTSANPIGIEATGLILSSYSNLRNGGVNSLNSIVLAGNPCDSIIWQKVSPGPPFGARMPFDGPPFWDVSSRRLLADWIAEGARDN